MHSAFTQDEQQQCTSAQHKLSNLLFLGCILLNLQVLIVIRPSVSVCQTDCAKESMQEVTLARSSLLSFGFKGMGYKNSTPSLTDLGILERLALSAIDSSYMQHTVELNPVAVKGLTHCKYAVTLQERCEDDTPRLPSCPPSLPQPCPCCPLPIAR